MKTWKVILAALVIFVAGAVTGGVVVWKKDKLTIAKAPPKPTGNALSPWVVHRPDFVDRMKGELGLTDEQAEKISNVIRRSRQRTDFLWESLKDPLQEELDRMKKGILAALTPEQQTKFEELIKPKPMKKPGDWGGHRRGGPDDKSKPGPPPGGWPPGGSPPGGQPPPELPPGPAPSTGER